MDKTSLACLDNVDNSVFVNLVERNPEPGGYALVDPDKSGKKSQFDLVELATQIQTADKFTRSNAGSKLSVIAEQVRFLQEQARKVLEEANLNAELHHIACNFKKVPGKLYYVYKKSDLNETKYMSMISPEEWGASCPDYVGAYKLEYDMSWTPVSKISQREDENVMINRILKAGTQLQLTLN